MNVEMKAEIDVNGPQEIQGGHNHSMGGRGGGRGSGRQRFGGPGGRPRDDMRGTMRQDVSKLFYCMYCAYMFERSKVCCLLRSPVFGRFH